MVSLITNFAIKYAGILITAGVGIIVRAAEKTAIVKKYQAQISQLVSDIKDASQNKN